MRSTGLFPERAFKHEWTEGLGGWFEDSYYSNIGIFIRSLLFSFFYLARLRLTTQSFGLANQVLYCLSHSSTPLALVIFWRLGLMNYLPRLAWNGDPPTST
jgi:hypothetical protein